MIGKPIDPADTEDKYPLVCAKPASADQLASLTGTTSFGAINSTPAHGTDFDVSVPLTNSFSRFQARRPGKSGVLVAPRRASPAEGVGGATVPP
ncbi:hypothetical protein [Nocardia sp. NPDC051981]|uniref:hypothetical protein n=1 Tax=Nocardia sp. NPDC051981 TaxID=3155417 RepID=UPI00342C819A